MLSGSSCGLAARRATTVGTGGGTSSRRASATSATMTTTSSAQMRPKMLVGAVPVAAAAAALPPSVVRTSTLAPARRPTGAMTKSKDKATTPPLTTTPVSAYVPYPSPSSPGNFNNDVPPPAAVFSEAARKALFRAADVCRRIGWASFWTQLALSIASAGILLFSVAFTAQNGPAVSLYATLFGVVAAFLSTFWTYGYTRLARRLRALAAAAARGGPLPADMVRKGDVVATLRAGCYVNLAGLAATLLGLQATVGLLVAKTLTNATANPFLAGGAGSYSPVLALDVFLVQASTNTALAHFVSLVASLWLIRVVGAPVPAAPGTKPAGG